MDPEVLSLGKKSKDGRHLTTSDWLTAKRVRVCLVEAVLLRLFTQRTIPFIPYVLTAGHLSERLTGTWLESPRGRWLGKVNLGSPRCTKRLPTPVFSL